MWDFIVNTDFFPSLDIRILKGNNFDSNTTGNKISNFYTSGPR